MEELCPVKATDAYLNSRGPEQDYFFCAYSSPLTKYQFWNLTDMALHKVGVQDVKFGAHSFRFGTASTAAALGYHHEDIKQIGQWASSAYHRYIRTLPNV